MSNHEAEPDSICWTSMWQVGSNFDSDKLQDDKKACIFKPRGLNIIWGRDGRYWIVPNHDREDAAAELKQVSWFEVTGSVDLVPGKKYQISFTISMTADASGWGGAPLFLKAKIGRKGRDQWKRIRCMDKNGVGPFVIPQDNFVISVPPSTTDPKLYFGLYEVWSQKRKTGLQLHEALVEEVSAAST